MTRSQHGRLPTMNDPAIYRISVKGSLDPSMSNRLGGMSITEKCLPKGEVETILVGRLQDQAALSGVLNTLYELHLPVLSANFLESD